MGNGGWWAGWLGKPLRVAGIVLTAEKLAYVPSVPTFPDAVGSALLTFFPQGTLAVRTLRIRTVGDPTNRAK